MRDNDLRARFARMRREEEAQAPEFVIPSGTRPERSRSRSASRLIVVTACLAAITASVIWLRPASPKPARNGDPVASLTEWKAPTDFLLETPGRELLRTVPAIGVWDHPKPSTPRPIHPQVRKQPLPDSLPDKEERL